MGYLVGRDSLVNVLFNEFFITVPSQTSVVIRRRVGRRPRDLFAPPCPRLCRLRVCQQLVRSRRIVCLGRIPRVATRVLGGHAHDRVRAEDGETAVVPDPLVAPAVVRAI